jgi:hypothetical protein
MRTPEQIAIAKGPGGQKISLAEKTVNAIIWADQHGNLPNKHTLSAYVFRFACETTALRQKRTLTAGWHTWFEPTVDDQPASTTLPNGRSSIR